MKRFARRSRARALRQLIRRALGPLTGWGIVTCLKATTLVLAPNGA